MYYPKSQISTGLYSNGELVFKSTKKPYTGPYWKNSKGQFFTGKTPQNTPVYELIEYNPSQPIKDNNRPNVQYYDSTVGFDPNINENTNIPISDSTGAEVDIFEYLNIKKIDSKFQTTLPTYLPNIPTNDDYQIGEFKRYFCKKINEITYIEINKEQYDLIKNKDAKIVYEYYEPFNISWRLTGDKKIVQNINSNMVKLAIFQKKLPMFDIYLKEDYTKYYK